MPIIGREVAVRRLHEAWATAVSARRQIACVAGEAEIGKTTVIDRFVAGLGSTAVARGQCVEQYGAGEPYLSVLEALGARCKADPALPPLLRMIAPTWFLCLAAEAALLNADADAAERHVADSLGYAERLGEHLFVPDLLLCRARTELAAGRAAAAREALRDAARRAEEMQALTTELAARSALCEFGCSAEAEVRALRTLLAQVPAATRAPLVVRARELLATADLAG